MSTLDPSTIDSNQSGQLTQGLDTCHKGRDDQDNRESWSHLSKDS